MLTDNNLLKLMTWNSPNFPIGSFVYSHGLEYSVEIGLVNDQPSLVNWIEGIILFGSGRVDASLLKAAYTAFEKENYSLLNKIVERADTQKSTKEFSLESKTQGSAFLKTLINSPFFLMKVPLEVCSVNIFAAHGSICLLYTSPSPRD